MTQHERLYNLLSDNRPHRTDEIVNVVYPSANICFHCGRGDLKNGKWRGKLNCVIRGWNDEKIHALHWYQMDGPVPISARTSPPAYSPKPVEMNQPQLFT